jgi:hypothetical protein
MKASFTVKTTGGTTAQLLGLSNALWLSNRDSRSFNFCHYRTTTGTYWSFAIQPLLYPHERVIEIPEVTHQGEFLNEGEVLISNPELPDSRNVKENIVSKLVANRVIRELVYKVRREAVVAGNIANLKRVPKTFRYVSGIFVPIVDPQVFGELQARFDRSPFENPFERSAETYDVVIHYRLGDMIHVPNRLPGFGGHGITSPETFRNVMEREDMVSKSSRVAVVSDSPELAKKLMEEVGVNCTVMPPGSVWRDLKIIGNAALFLGSSSQFSAFGATICARNNGIPYLPDRVFDQPELPAEQRLPEFRYFKHSFIPDGHWLFHSN